jgi:hypothetical protein
MKEGRRGLAMGRLQRGQGPAVAVARVGCVARGTAIGLAPSASGSKKCQ